jgi:hypothetical protein
MSVDACDRALDEMERALDDVRLALVEATIDERATTREEDDAREFRARAAATSGAVVDAIETRLRRTRREVLDARSREFPGGSGGKAAMVTRCGRVETRARDARRDARAFARGDDISPVIPRVKSGTSGRTSGETREESGAMASIRSALRGLGLGGSAASAREDAAVDAPRYSREQREREANSGVETRGRSARDRAFVNERGEGSLGVSRGTWFAGAAESLARVGAAATETPTTARETREDDGAVEDEPSSSTRDALSGARTTVATTTATTSRARSPPDAAAAERARRLDAMRGADRLDASSDVLAQCADVLDRTQDVGASVLETLAAQRESLTRSGAAAREASKKMDRNLKVVKGMNSWTRLGC